MSNVNKLRLRLQLAGNRLKEADVLRQMALDDIADALLEGQAALTVDEMAAIADISVETASFLLEK